MKTVVLIAIVATLLMITPTTTASCMNPDPPHIRAIGGKCNPAQHECLNEAGINYVGAKVYWHNDSVEEYAYVNTAPLNQCT